ncbi:MAG: L,D-transpeptidase family protein [Ginsengibacter sp.]
MFIPAFLGAQAVDSYDRYLKTSNQVLFVTAPGWNATQGLMRLYGRKDNHHPWKLVNQFAVTLGRNGLGFDRNSILSKPVPLVTKQEGDGKSPAGIFSLGPVFSFHSLKGLKMPFKEVDTSDICVDDTRSSHYNTWVNTDTASHKDWNSFEHMKSGDGSYEYGVWVRYNSDKIFSGDGSCIFLHVWSGNTIPTSGCTAMEKENMIELIHWLDDKQHPVLLQLVENK